MDVVRNIFAIVGAVTVIYMLALVWVTWRAGREPERAARQIGGWR